MIFLRTVSLYILLLFLGCASNKSIVIKNFESSNSPCIDALTVNMIAAGCTDIYFSVIDESQPVTTIQCAASVGPLNHWTSGKFYLLSDNSLIDPTQYSIVPFCADLNVVLFFEVN